MHCPYAVTLVAELRYHHHIWPACHKSLPLILSYPFTWMLVGLQLVTWSARHWLVYWHSDSACLALALNCNGIPGPAMFNGKPRAGNSREFPVSRETGGKFFGPREFPSFRNFPRFGNFPSHGKFPNLGKCPGISREFPVSREFPEVRKFPAHFPGNGKFPGISRPRLPVEHR